MVKKGLEKRKYLQEEAEEVETLEANLIQDVEETLEVEKVVDDSQGLQDVVGDGGGDSQ